MTIALIPVKRLEQSKSRLFSTLADGERQALTLAMLEDLIEALAASGAVSRIAVTTPDETVAARARAAGAEVVMRPEPGLNAALEDAIERLDPAPDEALLVVLGDVAGATGEDLRKLVAAGCSSPERPGLWLAPSSDGGTSALLLVPARAIRPRFGRDSARQHLEAARSAGIAGQVVSLPSLAIDLDQPEDLVAFLATAGGGVRTRALLSARERSGDAPRRRPASE